MVMVGLRLFGMLMMVCIVIFRSMLYRKGECLLRFFDMCLSK